MPQWSCQIVDLRVDSKIVAADNFVGLDSDKPAAETDSPENPTAENIATSGILLKILILLSLLKIVLKVLLIASENFYCSCIFLQ